MYADNIIEELNKAIGEANLSSVYNLKDDTAGIYIGLNKNNRISINHFILPYKPENIENLKVEGNENETGLFVSVLLDDGLELRLKESGLTMVIDDVEFHSTNAVLGRLYYKYKCMIGEKINPLIIKNKEVIVFCGSSQYVKVPEDVRVIGEYAFEYSNVEYVTLPESVNRLSEYCFKDCQKLKNIIFNNENIYVGMEILDEIKRPVIQIPYSVKNIGNNSFFGCNVEIKLHTSR